MSTHALVRIHEDGLESPVILTLYKQYDGYFKDPGLGDKLKEFCKKYTIGGGISGNAKFGEYANGMGCFAAQLVANFKVELGDWYVVKPDSCEEEFTYDIYEINGSVGLVGKEYRGETKHFLGNFIESEDLPILEFVYQKSYAHDPEWRKVKVTEETNEYIKGFDLNDDDSFKNFRKDRIVGGKIIRD